VFAARPERGLNELVGKNGIMEMLPDYHLTVCGYENTTEPMANYYKYLWGRCNELPNVTNVGPLGKRDLYELLARSMLYVYPTTFEDTSCIMVLESNAAGTPFIGMKHAALPETCKDSGSVLLPLKNNKVDKKAFAQKIREILGNKSEWDRLHHRALKKNQSWESAAKQWDTLFRDLLKAKCSNKTRLYKHMEQMSDVYCIKEDYKEELKDNYYFMYSGDYKGHYKKYYQYEADRGVNYGPENMSGIMRFEQMFQIIKNLKPKTILDYGCAHGLVTMNLADRMPDVEFIGVDISSANIEKAKKWAAKDNVNASFICGTEDEVPENIKCDVVIISELLEHVPDPQKIVKAMMAHLKPGGHIVTSTPYGPWEAIGYDKHQGWRAHIHHLERSDLYEMFGGQKNYKLMAVPNNEGFGHFICTFQPSNKPLGTVNYERKLSEQAPKETLSVCMIVKDCEYSIGKTLNSVKGIADEIIIGIDNTTTDDTKRVCESFGAQTFPMPSPLEIGFDECRNLTIERSKMDWIFWIDSDETLEQSMNINKYLRPSCYNAYAIKQHHYAVEPAELFRTDFPARLFRNHKGIKFFGFVHEHPELELNEGIGKVNIISDVAIMHTGYSTEEIRRKRFMRNFPLMQEDRKKYPNRKLGQFLWMRDIAHICKYSLEKTRGIRTAEIQAYAKEVIKIWREILNEKNTRFIVEGLQYYSEAVNVLGGGIEFKIDLKAINKNGGSYPSKPLAGLFADKEDIKRLTEHMANETTKYYGEKYY